MKIHIPDIFPVTCHTRHVGLGSTFVAIKGTQFDGHDYIQEAINRGATRIVALSCHPAVSTEASCKGRELGLGSSHHITRVPDTRLALAQLSAQALDYPAKKLKIIGITGTKGKSTTTYLVEHILSSAGYKTALLSTIKNKILDTWLPTELTTQQPDYLHVFFNECVKAGVEWVVMEVAAQAFTCHRVAGIEFDVALFTNFSKEHGEFYVTEDDYFADKQKLFTQLKPQGVAILNGDDVRVAVCSITHGTKRVYSLSEVQIFSNSLAGLAVCLMNPMKQSRSHRAESRCATAQVLKAPALVGTFNAYNMLAAYTVAQSCGASFEQIQAALQTFTGVPGRLAKYDLPNGATAFIDYAHNPLSFEALFSTLRPYTKQLIVVFGGGGDRDKTKRPIMGAIASTFADIVILTSDNPRSENPADIVQHIYAGIMPQEQYKIIIELDRERAIHKAYELSQKNSIIVLLGKGPDEYQLIKGVKYPFSEAQILKAL